MLKLTSSMVLMTLTVWLSQAASVKAPDHEVIPKDLIFMGEWEGKQYYRDPDTVYNHSGAQQRCETLGMELVTITNTPQLEFIRSKVTYGHWTAAKAIGAYNSTLEPSLITLPPTWVHEDYMTCLAVNFQFYFTDTCGEDFYALCYL